MADRGHGHTFRLDGYVVLTSGEERGWYEHRWLAAKALGRALPPGAEVHHVDGCRWNNSPGNLVVCPDAEYHRLLHERTKALGLFVEVEEPKARAA